MAPLVYVTPTATMIIKPGKHVDQKGKVYMPYLHEWKQPKSNTLGLIIKLCVVFGENPPLYARPTEPPPVTHPPVNPMANRPPVYPPDMPSVNPTLPVTATPDRQLVADNHPAAIQVFDASDECCASASKPTKKLSVAAAKQVRMFFANIK